MKSDIGALKAYMGMLLDGTAFCNWKNPPDAKTREQIVNKVMKSDHFGSKLDMRKSDHFGSKLDMRDIQKVVTEARSEKELKRLLNDMLIKEDEFLV